MAKRERHEVEIVDTDAAPTTHAHSTVAQIVYTILAIVETMLAFRLLLKIAGANSGNGFVQFVYAITNPFVAPFAGIFPNATGDGALTRATLEPSTIVAMIVYAVIAWLAVRFTAIGADSRHEYGETHGRLR